MDVKQSFVDELKRHYQQIISGAHQAETRDGTAADEIRSEARSRDDAKGAVELARRSRAHRERRERARGELETLISFAARGLWRLPRDAAVGLGALVDVSVVTPASPLGRALQGTRVGDSVEIEVGGRDRAWTVQYVS